MSTFSWDLIDAATCEESNRGRSKTVFFTEGVSPECLLLRHTALGEWEDAPGRQYPQMHMLSGSKYWLADVGAGLAFTAGNSQTVGQKGEDYPGCYSRLFNKCVYASQIYLDQLEGSICSFMNTRLKRKWWITTMWSSRVSSLSLSGSGQRSRSELTYFAKAGHTLNDGLHEHSWLLAYWRHSWSQITSAHSFVILGCPP